MLILVRGVPRSAISSARAAPSSRSCAVASSAATQLRFFSLLIKSLLSILITPRASPQRRDASGRRFRGRPQLEPDLKPNSLDRVKFRLKKVVSQQYRRKDFGQLQLVWLPRDTLHRLKPSPLSPPISQTVTEFSIDKGRRWKRDVELSVGRHAPKRSFQVYRTRKDLGQFQRALDCPCLIIEDFRYSSKETCSPNTLKLQRNSNSLVSTQYLPQNG